MEFHQVRYFLAACDHMNFTRAAEASGVSQPALTVAIRKLEQELGGPLFLREGRALSLTTLGQTMRTHLGRVEKTRQAAYLAAEEISSGAGRLELGIMCTIGPRLIGPAIADWRQAEGDAELTLYDISGASAIELLLSGALDCVLIATQDRLPLRFEAFELLTEQFELALGQSHPLASARALSLSDLEGISYLDRLHCEFRETVFDLSVRHGVMLDVVLRSEREDWIQQLVADGRGVTMLPRSSVVVDGITTRPVSDLPVERRISLVTVRGRPVSSVVERFIDFMRQYDWSGVHSKA